MDKQFNHNKTEEKIYKMWEDNGYFKPETFLNTKNTKEETFSVLMPPPNANAPLHCGHATYAIQDLYARYKRMQGYKTLYLPGTDHAGFETQVVYERKLKKEGKSRFDFDSKTLYNDILNFVKENSEVAIGQLKRLGMSADWSRNTFMLDDHVIDTVYDTFIKMHADGLVYKDYYLVNYSVFHGTTFSNLETTHIETKSPLYYVSYKLTDSDEKLTVATVRPETIYADVALAVNPKDSRYENFVGKSVVNPLTNDSMPVIADSYVDIEFGTGVLKITPGHDFNDFEIGKKHGLKMFSIIGLDGKLTEKAGECSGMRVFSARKRSVEILQTLGALDKVDEKYTNNLLVDYKDKKSIEPLLIPNWFIKMEGLAKKAATAVENNEVSFNQETWKNQILMWLNNIYDWPISRQIVFGIRIPVWYETSDANKDKLHVVFISKKGEVVEGTLDKVLDDGYTVADVNNGLQKLIAETDAKYVLSKESPSENYIQETDTFDTWFSSGQWPQTTLKYPDGVDFKEFFPTSFMDSMWGILFFWIARMIMFSLYLSEDVPFKNVYIHGRITDAKGKKMSKSLGNVIDPLEFVEKYGADALRMGIMVGGNTTAKQTSLSEDSVRSYRNFSNKIWNMARFMFLMFEQEGIESEKDLVSYDEKSSNDFSKLDIEVLNELKNLKKDVSKNLNSYNIKAAGDMLYHFLWDSIADIYIEDVKNRDAQEKILGLSILHSVFGDCLKMLHPFMPFVTEEIWSYIREFSDNKLRHLIVTEWPK